MSRQYRKRKRAEAEERTRQRITEATMRLHEEVGPAKTTVSGIAERAGVQRATVYRHFPDEEALVDACSSHWLSLNAPPDITTWAAIADPDERLRHGLDELYSWYEGTEAMVEMLNRDRHSVAPIAQRMKGRDALLDAAADVLVSGRPERGARRRRVRAAIGHAVQFETWRSLRNEGLARDEAIDLIAGLAG